MWQTFARAGFLALLAITLMAATPPSNIIRSRAELNDYLRTTAQSGSPIDCLAPSARSRFINSLVFTERGLGGFSPADLQAELTASQVFAILKLFGAEEYAPGIDARVVTAEDRAIKSRAPGSDSTHYCDSNGSCSPRTDWICSPAFGSGAESEINKLYDRFYDPRYNSLDSSVQKAAQDKYDALFGSFQRHAALSMLTTSDVDTLFRAAATIDDVSDMQIDLAALERKDAASQPQYDQLWDALITDHRYVAAAAVERAHPSPYMARVPAFRDLSSNGKNGPTELVLSRDGALLVRRDVDLRGRAQVVVISGCHNADDALREIDSDPVLRGVFRAHATWLNETASDLSETALSNKEHSQELMTLVYDTKEWPMVDNWAMPTFYFFKNGRLAAKVVGWLGHRTEIEAALRQVGLAY